MIHFRLTLAVLLMSCMAGSVFAEQELPMGKAPEPVDIPYFPSRMHAFIWRNWQTADLDRIAKVLGTNEANIVAVAESMGLPPHRPVSDLQKQRGYISVIRRNWHLLNYDQLLTLLDWDADELAYTLKEDDFLWVKLGRLKPDCDPLRYAAPTDEQNRRAAEIKAVVQKHFGDEMADPGQPRFAFVDELSSPVPGFENSDRDDGESIRFIYSYFAVYGDPLLNPELDPYPDGLLQRLAAQGVNGVWLHVVLRQLTPSETFPEFGENHATRLDTLRKLVRRAARYGIKVYLYMNEPRSMPASFFDKHPEIRGAEEDGNYAMCTSVPEVRQYVEDGLAYVFDHVPGLGGVFAITMSENLTNCWSRGGQARCPRCSKREPADVVAEINATIARGVWKGNPDAAVICWDWGWRDAWAEQVIARLPKGVHFMSVSEWSLPIERGGVKSTVGEYSISAVGPGPRATRHWAAARKNGLRTIAKVQVNNTWELSAVPYLPTMDLVAEHMHNLAEAGIDGQMLSWSLGGYPSVNLQVARAFADRPDATPGQVLRDAAVSRYGTAAAGHVLAAWSKCSDAFREFPYNTTVLYGGPQQVGPANPLYLKPTGYGATMVGIPYDDLRTWRAIYPPDVFIAQFDKVADGFKAALTDLRQALDVTDHREAVEEDLGITEAAYAHFRSVANQARFVIARDAGDKLGMRRMAENEIDLARRVFRLTRHDARIGYEASNHYYYYPFDLVEKVICCQDVIDKVASDSK